MNRTDRLFALLLELRGGGWTPAEDLARTFGVSVRTVYRDMLALGEAGVPLVSLPGKGYRLLEGYFLPPLHLTVEEAVMLTLGGDAVRGAFDAEYAQALTSALRKLEAALPEGKRVEVVELRRHLRVIPPNESGDAETLRRLRAAVLGRRAVAFAYHKPDAPVETREVYPLSLIHLNGVWLLGAFDPARGARRTFRLTRMAEVRLLPQTFELDPRWRAGPAPERERRGVRVRLQFPDELRRAVRERPHFFQTAAQDVAGGFEVTLQVRDLRDVLAWVLSWGAGVQVLEPPELREQVREEARRMLLT
ncbi:YafY family protein [Deinococcus sp. YIM 77859]|uniref:helix-turn-helix transcriptional regulator n=1 Tax=Deinococcus sp. YIM 77859 TaxID=1540221 RepID=UPI0005596D1A|nr:YafY family protein [Deinococcus sp. YIM 77859]